MSKNTVIFDFDGTIADTVPVMLQVANEIAMEHKWKEFTEDQFKMLRDKTPQQLIKELQIPIFKIPFLVSRGQQLLKKYMPHVGYIKGMKEALGNLKEKELYLGIVSSNSRENIDTFINSHGMNFFDFIYCEKNIFGKASVLDHTIKKLGFNKAETIYVGDEIRDIEACRKIGLDIISVTWGLGTKRLLQSGSPNFIIDDPKELLDIID